jgi:hypothetical protein
VERPYGLLRVSIPPSTPTGQNYVIMALDFQGAVPESNETNNIAFVPIQVVPPGTLRVTSTYLSACLGLTATLLLEYAGGTPGTGTWSVIGSLPAGLAFDPATNAISITPTAAPGIYTVTVQVDVGSETASQVLAIRVRGDCIG